TLKLQEAPGASVAPDKLMLLDPATAVMVPPPQLPLSPFGVPTTSPAGSVSVKPTPVSASGGVLGFWIMKVRLVEPLSGMLAAPNDLVIEGGCSAPLATVAGSRASKSSPIIATAPRSAHEPPRAGRFRRSRPIIGHLPYPPRPANRPSSLLNVRTP